MRLTRTERLILYNQYRILEALYPDEAEYYAEAGEAVAHGYELHYFPDHIYNEDSIMTVEECREVLDILSMFRTLKFSYEDLPDKNGIDQRDIEFRGFDGNDEIEGKYMMYAIYFCSHNGGRFKELNRADDFNSHCPMLRRYRTMLSRWNAMCKPYQLNKEQIQEIIAR